MEILLKGIRIHYLEAGRGTPLFLLHGNAGSGQVWRKVMPTISEHYRTIAHDRQGFGQSESTEFGDFSPFGYAEELAELMQILGIPKGHICGLSFGGMVAQVFALRYPHLVKKLILVGTMADRTGRDVETTLETLNSEGWSEVAKTLSQSWFYPGSDPNDVKEAYSICLQSSERMRELTVKALGAFDIKNKIHKITAQTLILAGADYKNTPIKFSEFLRDNIPDSKLTVIPNCGHLVPVDQPEEFCNHVLRFLEN